MVGLTAYVEWMSWLTLIGLYQREHENEPYLAPLLLGLLCNYILNIVNSILLKIYVYEDPEFQKWLGQSASHKIAT